MRVTKRFLRKKLSATIESKFTTTFFNHKIWLTVIAIAYLLGF